MSRSDKDKMADALNALAGGQHNDDQAGEEIVSHDVSAAEDAPVAEQVAEQLPPPAPGVASNRPASLRPAAPQISVQQASSSRPIVPSRPAAPGTPAVRPPAAASRPARPAAPVIAPQPQTPTVATRPQSPPTQTAEAAVPAVKPVQYAAKKPVARKKKKSITGSIEFRRTMIPPCLVVGGSFVVMAGLFFLQPESAALRQMRVILPIGIGILGLVLLGVGAFNVILVKKELDAKRQRHV